MVFVNQNECTVFSQLYTHKHTNTEQKTDKKGAEKKKHQRRRWQKIGKILSSGKLRKVSDCGFCRFAAAAASINSRVERYRFPFELKIDNRGRDMQCVSFVRL